MTPRLSRPGVGLLGAAIVLALAVPTAAAQGATEGDESVAAVPGRVLVTWHPQASVDVRDRVREAHGLTTVDVIEALDLEALHVPAGSPTGVATQLAMDPAVAIAEPDYLLEADVVDDPQFDDQWGLHNTGQEGGVADVDIDALEAWEHTTGSPDVVVGVIDTGMDIAHPDLADNIWTNPDEVPGNGVDDDGNGYVDDVHGWDFVDDDPTVRHSPVGDQHATHVAGTIAAVADNGRGVAGVAPDVQIMPLRFLDSGEGAGSTLDAVEAVAYAAANGARVVNASWGGDDGSETLRNAIARARGTAVIAAVGNQAIDIDVTARYPAEWANDIHGVDNLLSVTAVGRSGRLASYANFGVATVDVAAPGSDIVSTAPEGAYASSSGTSMAAPHVAGVAALAASLDDDLTGSQLVDLVKAGSRPLGTLAGVTTTGGLVNAADTIALVEERLARALDVDATACPEAEVPATGFGDLTGGLHDPAIACMVWWQVADGVTAERFAPDEAVTRGQMAAFVARSVRAAGASLPTATDPFTDDDGGVHEDDIGALVAAGIVRGVAPDRYDPARPVTRAEMAAFLIRADGYLHGTVPTSTIDAFVDDDGSVHEPAIDAAHAVGLVRGTSADTFAPTRSVTRAEMATFLSRLLDRAVAAGLASTPS